MAAPPEDARNVYNEFLEKVKRTVFMMSVEMENEKQAKGVVAELTSYPFMMSGMPRPVRAKPAKIEMFADRPTLPDRKIQVRWVEASDPNFKVANDLKLLYKLQHADHLAMVKHLLDEEEKIEKKQEETLQGNYCDDYNYSCEISLEVQERWFQLLKNSLRAPTIVAWGENDAHHLGQVNSERASRWWRLQHDFVAGRQRRDPNAGPYSQPQPLKLLLLAGKCWIGLKATSVVGKW